MANEYPIAFGKYLLLERIAVGGMAEVFKAISRSIEGVEKVVALKRILPEYSLDEEFVALFIDEARISATLQHPNIVQVFDFGKIERNYYLAMEFVDGPNLKNLIRKIYQNEDEFPIEFAIYIIVQLLKALDYLHRATDSSNRPLYVIHRDISPQNILLSREAAVKVTDFGIAKAASKLSKTVPGKIQGKFGYMSPEQARGKELDHRSDLFSLGIIFFEMLTGKRLYGGENTFVRYENVKEAKVQRVSKFRDVPEALDNIVAKMLQKNPEDRYQNSSDLQRDLTDILYPANVETVIKSLSDAIEKYYPKAVSIDREKSEEHQKDTEKKGWWLKKKDSDRETKTITMHQKADDLKSKEPSVTGADIIVADENKKEGGEKITSLDSKRKKHRTRSREDDTVRKDKDNDNVIEMHTKSGRSSSFKRRDRVGALAQTARVFSIVFVGALVIIACLIGITLAAPEVNTPVKGLLKKLAMKQVKPEFTNVENKNQELEEKLQAADFQARQLQQRLDDLTAGEKSIADKLSDSNKKLRELEELMTKEQNGWDKERKTLLAELSGVKAQLAQAQQKCPDGMIYIPAGKFLFGSKETDPERNLGELAQVMDSVKGFCIDKFEFPNRQGSQPKVGVTWNEARSMCEQEGKRLCSEREWERSCKGSQNQRYGYSNGWQEGTCSTESSSGSDGKLSASGENKQCVSDFGVVDLSGNAMEWTEVSGSVGTDGMPVAKGGAFDRPGYWSRCASRLSLPVDAKNNAVGFRCCKDPR